MPESNVPTMPDHLGELARLEWTRMLGDLEDSITAVDGPALAAYCVAYGRWKDAELNIQKFGTVIKSPAGNPIPNPYLAVAEKSLDIMRQWLAELQCTPRARAANKEQGCI